jgi:hypothetical protein
MACTSCKNKSNKEIIKQTEGLSKTPLIVFIIWSLLGIYGLISLIRLFI